MPPAIENRVQGREKPFFSYKYWSFFFLENGQYHLFAALLWDSGHGSPEPGLPYMQWGMDNAWDFWATGIDADVRAGARERKKQ